MHILKPALLPCANTHSNDIMAYLPVHYTTSWMSLCTSLAVYNQVKQLITDEWTSVLGQKKKSAAHRRVGVLQIVFWLSSEHTNDLHAQSSCLGFTISSIPLYSLKQTLKQS